MQFEKSISRIDPLTTRPRSACERHYVQVHTKFARRVLRDNPGVLSYHTNLARAQYDISLGWDQEPLAWRFIILRFKPGGALGFSDETKREIELDHLNCLRSLRTCPVTEDILVDRTNGQTSLAKYLFEFDRFPQTPHAEAQRRFDNLVHVLAEKSEAVFGMRILVKNTVLGEQVAEPIEEEGQRPTGQMAESTDKVGYLEAYFDNDECASEFLARGDVACILRDHFFVTAAGYRIEERCGVDRR